MESKGRIITTGSIAGTISWPGGSAYAGSKHWIEAYTDALAGEMAPHGVAVSVVEPGNYKSHIRRGSWQRAFEQVKAAGEEITEEMKQAYEATAERELSYKEPDEVTAAFMHALFDEKPLLRYVVVPNEGEQERTIQTKMNELVQLNTWGPYSYSRDEYLPEGFAHDTMPDMDELLALGCKKQKLRAHSDYYPNRAVNEWALSFNEFADIMAESKAKNLASIDLYNYGVKSGAIQGSVYTHRELESSTF